MLRRGIFKGFYFDRKLFLKFFILAILLSILVFILTFFIFNNNVSICKDKECFFNKLIVCEPSKFTSYGNITFEYNINGLKEGYCDVNVKFIRSYWRSNSFNILNGKSMNCDIPYGQSILPEEDLNLCHGELKEGLQEMILAKLQTYILENLAI